MERGNQIVSTRPGEVHHRRIGGPLVHRGKGNHRDQGSAVARSVVKKFMRVAHSNSSSATARKPSSRRRTAPDVVDQHIDPTVLVHRSLHQRTRRPMRSVHSVPQSAL